MLHFWYTYLKICVNHITIPNGIFEKRLKIEKIQSFLKKSENVFHFLNFHAFDIGSDFCGFFVNFVTLSALTNVNPATNVLVTIASNTELHPK